MPACQQPASLCSQQDRACACAAMQLLAATQLLGPGSGPGPTQLHGCKQLHGCAGGGAALLAAKRCRLLACRHVYVDECICICICQLRGKYVSTTRTICVGYTGNLSATRKICVGYANNMSAAQQSMAAKRQICRLRERHGSSARKIYQLHVKP